MTEEKPSMEELERMFDEGVDVAQYADYSDRPGLRQRRVGVDMPLAMIDRLDARASAAGVARQALIKSWLAERLDLEDRLDALAHLGMPRPAPRPAPKEQAAEGQGAGDQAES
ncbi:type II toxin-antitoxin system BrnA family antitoxin [Paratractidigestivibacter faecalis]|uniref:type II toxin-antitoxin system BrnA family antitoxin n=1 Tax=Paratractidigestivibacter faecalis TaxID=2292441 RepID=UPI003A925F5C